MAFSRANQGWYRPLVKAAWELHCKRSGGDVSDAAARDEWTKDHLERATGKRSTKDCNQGRHPERACAHFERLAEAGYKYNMMMIQGDLRRIKNAAKNVSKHYLRQFNGDADFERHVKTLLEPMFQGRNIPELHALNDGQIHWLTQAVRVEANAYG